MIALLLACTDASPPGPRPEPSGPQVAQALAPGGPRLDRDLDGDGVTVADGDCDDLSVAVRPGAAEICNGADDDCDGSVDQADDSVDPYTCAYCPDPTLYDESLISWSWMEPCVLDPAVECSSHVHRRAERTDGHPFREELLLFLPPGPGAWNDTILKWGAWSGYRVLSLGWRNDDHHAECQDDEACVLAVRHEQLYGVDTTPHEVVEPNDAIIGRLERLLQELARTEPDNGWERYWTEADGVRWDQIVVFGWSWGSGQAAYVARQFEVAGLLMISGPNPAAWLAEPSATPACREYAFYHELDELGADGTDLAAVLEGMGLEGPAVDCDTEAPPYGGAQILTTAETDFQDGSCGYHSATAYDGCVAEQLITPYLYLYCSAADTPRCP